MEDLYRAVPFLTPLVQLKHPGLMLQGLIWQAL
jgi:hypothetical protein